MLRKMIQVTVILALVVSAPAFVVGADHTKDTAETVKKNLADKKAVLVDVREQNEWDEGHLKDATLLPLSKLQGGADTKNLPKDKIIYLHCKAGGRCLKAAEILEKAGYQVRALKPGYADLVELGFPKAEKK